MRVIEQLIQHFWQSGELSRGKVQTLLDYGFVRPEALSGWEVDEKDRPSPLETSGDEIKVEDPWEDRPQPRAGGKGRRSKDRPIPSGHDLEPLRALLAGHFATRAPFRGLMKLGTRLRPCADWAGAAAVVAKTTHAAKLEGALVGLLNANPRALGELWFWFDLRPLETWCAAKANKGPVADALARLLRAATLFEAGRAMQLLEAPEVQDLLALLAARRRFLAVLPVLFGRHFARLGHWLVEPAGQAAESWPALSWAFLLVSNARRGSVEKPLPGYPMSWDLVTEANRKRAWTTAWALEPARLPVLLREEVRNDPLFPAHDPEAACPRVVMPLVCPLNWRV